MRAHDLVTTERDGRVIRYQLADEQVHDLFHKLMPEAAAHPADASGRLARS